MSWRIEQPGLSGPTFLALKLGRNYGSPAGAFTQNEADVTLFPTEAEAARALQNLGAASSLCTVKEVSGRRLPPELGGFPRSPATASDVTNKL